MPIMSIADSYRSDPQEGLVFLFWPVAVIDLPLAITVDTLFLPYDIYKINIINEKHDAISAPSKQVNESEIDNKENPNK